MSKTFFSVLVFGALASVGVSFYDGLTLDGECIVVYLSMILGALTAIGRNLEEGS